MVLAVGFTIFGSRFIKVDDGVRPGPARHRRQLDLERIRRVGSWMLNGVVERVSVELVRLRLAVVE